MAFSYDPEELHIELNRIRLELSDTDSRSPLLQDEEIIQVQLEENSFFTRVAKCCRLIMTHFARRPKIKIDGFSEDPSGLYDKYSELYNKYSLIASSSHPWASSVDSVTKENMALNSRFVKPKIKIGLHDHE